MTVVMTEGWDMYNGVGQFTGASSRYTGTTSTGGISLVAGRFGAQALRCNGTVSGQLIGRLPSAYSSFTWGGAFRYITLNSAFDGTYWPFVLFSGSSGTVNQLAFKANRFGQIEFWRGGTTLLGSTPIGSIIFNVWQFLEIEIVISDTVGRITCKIDSTTQLNLTSIDTRNGTPTTVDTIAYGMAAGDNRLGGFDVDDVYILDAATSIGERKIETLRPNADTATKQWTPNSGTADFSQVNETLVDGDTTYIQTSTSGDRDLYTIGSLSSTPITIDCISLISFAEKTDVGSRAIYNSCQSSGTDDDGSSFNLLGSYAYNSRVLLLDPNGSAAWTAARVNGLLVGPKVV